MTYTGFARFVFSLTLVTAATLKLWHPDPSPSTIGLLNDHRVLSLLINAEFVISAALLLSVASARSLHFLAMGVFAVFGTVAFYEFSNAAPSCGCFGNVKVPPAVIACFDFAAVGALWGTFPSADEPAAKVSPRRKGAFFVVAALATLIVWTTFFVRRAQSSNSLAGNSGDLIVMTPADWVGKPFPYFDSIDNSQAVHSGRWLIILYQHDCESCLAAIPAYEQLAGNPGAPHVAFVAMPLAAPIEQDPVQASGKYLHLALKMDHDWFATTPVVAEMNDGKVLAAYEGADATHVPVLHP